MALAIVGTALPIMPTVPFLIAAAFCFERGSPKLHAWIINHPQFGPPLNDWRNSRVIRWPAKVLAVGSLAVSGSYTCFFSAKPDWVKWTVGIVFILVSIFILSRKSKPNGV